MGYFQPKNFVYGFVDAAAGCVTVRLSPGSSGDRPIFAAIDPGEAPRINSDLML